MVTNLIGTRIYSSDPMPERRAKSLALGAVESLTLQMVS